jgi:hypothetical protein
VVSASHGRGDKRYPKVGQEVKSMIATTLIDGLAGIAIFALAYCLWRYLTGQQSNVRQAVLWAGIGAGLASLAQMVVGEIIQVRQPSPPR